MRKQWVIFIILATMPAAAFSWPWDQKEKEAKKEEPSWQSQLEDFKKSFMKRKETAESPSPQPQQEKKRPPQSEEERKAEEEKKARERLNATLRAVAVQKAVTSPALRPPLPRRIERPLTQSLAPPVADMRAIQVQQQVQEVIQINDTLQANSAGEAAEIQRLSEQTRIQQTILNKPFQAPTRTANLAGADSEEILRQQRVRLLAQQVQQPKPTVVVEDVTRRNR